MKRYQLLIDGEWRDPISGKWTPNVNPANTDDVIGEFASAGAEDITQAAAAAKRAFPGWRAGYGAWADSVPIRTSMMA